MLLHYDLHGGKLLAAGDDVHVIDWALACRAQAWVEAALFVPRLACLVDGVPRVQGHPWAEGRAWFPRPGGPGRAGLDHSPGEVTECVATCVLRVRRSGCGAVAGRLKEMSA